MAQAIKTSGGRPLAVVTGASSGIGYALAEQFVENGFDLVIASDSDSIHDAARRLKGRGATVETVQADLATYDGVEKLYNAIQATGKPVDSLAINAGVGVSGEFTNTSLDDELNLINLNVTSAVHLAKRIARDMVDAHHGRIMFTSSIAAVMPAPFLAVYGASKAFLFSFSEALRNELKETGVTVTALMPGPTDTNFFMRAGMEDTKAATGKKADPSDVAREGFKALMKGEDHIFAGSMKVKVQGAMAEILPETVKAEQHRRIAEPGSANGSAGGSRH